MALSSVELYERLKPHLGEGETKALIEYVDGKIRGEVATKEDVHLLKEDIHLLREDLLKVQADLEGKIQRVREELRGVQTNLEAKIQGVREEVWKLRLLIVVVLVVVVVLNPKVLELVGRVLGVAK